LYAFIISFNNADSETSDRTIILIALRLFYVQCIFLLSALQYQNIGQDKEKVMLNERRYSILDQFCLGIDQAVRAVFDNPKTTGRDYPVQAEIEPVLTEAQRKHSAGLMRINHTGEVCAQALYHGQGLASRSQTVKQKMQHAAIEEGDHLAWCRTRLFELGSHTSYLNPLWYLGSFTLGLSAGLIGDKWSLGFLAETEQQVVEHLDNHLQRISGEDPRSAHILRQMQWDEAQHRDAAVESGAAALPSMVKNVMRLSSKLMVKIAYWL
jgi:ubiquinone biosynthesis monooxygenase Coq7